MKRLLYLFLCLLFLTGCSQQSQPQEEADPPLKEDEPPLEETAESQDVALAIGRKLPLPVTEDSIRDYYESPDGFYRRVLELQETSGGFLVRSVPLPDAGEDADEVSRFDWVYTETGYCYALLEGRYSMEQLVYAGRGSVSLNDTDDWSGPAVVSAGLSRSLVDIDTGEPVRQTGLYCAPKVSESPPQIPLEDGALLTLHEDGGAASLEAVYLGADTLELLFEATAAVPFPQVEISYDEAAGELTLRCRDTDLRCAASGSNLYVEEVRAEQRGAADGDAVVVCSLGTAPPEEPWLHSAHAYAIQAELAYPPGYDFALGVLRVTFWPYMG